MASGVKTLHNLTPICCNMTHLQQFLEKMVCIDKVLSQRLQVQYGPYSAHRQEYTYRPVQYGPYNAHRQEYRPV